MTKPKKKNRFIYLYILIVLVLCFVIYLLPKLSDTMTKTVIAEYGTMELSDEVQCYAARNEKVYTAGSGGQTEYLVNEGARALRFSRYPEAARDSREINTPRYWRDWAAAPDSPTAILPQPTE